MTTELIQKMYDYNLWANTKMAEICCGLVDEQMYHEVEGVFGRIKPTLIHIIRAEAGYFRRTTGVQIFADDTDWANLSMDDLLAMVKKSSGKLAEVATEIDPATRHDVNWGGEPSYFHNWTVLLQVLYHGIEHRTQIKILLTQLGVDHPELAAWDFMDSLR